MLESAPKMQGQEMVEIQSMAHTGIGELRHTLKKALAPILHTDIINKATGLRAQITGTGINKIASKKAVDKSIANGFTRDEHFKAAEYIKELYESATPKSKDKDKNASPDIVAIHRFVSHLKINNKPAEAKITLKESMEHGSKIYSLELEELIPTP